MPIDISLVFRCSDHCKTFHASRLMELIKITLEQISLLNPLFCVLRSGCGIFFCSEFKSALIKSYSYVDWFVQNGRNALQGIPSSVVWSSLPLFCRQPGGCSRMWSTCHWSAEDVFCNEVVFSSSELVSLLSMYIQFLTESSICIIRCVPVFYQFLTWQSFIHTLPFLTGLISRIIELSSMVVIIFVIF